MTTRKLVVNDGQTEKELLIVGTVSVGRDPACNIQSLDPLLSRKHAEFAWSKLHVTIRDLESRNGILVNGIKVREQILRSGDVVQAGGMQFRYLETSTINTEEEHTRSRERTDTAVEPPTVAPVAAKKAAAAETATAPAFAGFDPDATFVGDRPAAAAVGSTASRVPTAGNLDATFAAPASAAVGAKRPAADPDATFAMNMRTRPEPPAAAHDMDATFAPGSFGLPAGNFDATMAPVRRPTAAVAAPAAAAAARPAPVEAQITVDRRLVVTSASAGCFELFGVRPEALVGGSAAEVLVQSLTSVAAPDGPPALSIALSRGSDRTLTLTFTAGQAVETAR